MLPIRGIDVAASDPAATRDFFAVFGYESDGAVLRRSAGATVVVTGSSSDGSVRRGWDLGPRGLDVYVHDLDDALDRVVRAGWRGGAIGSISLGPVRMRQVLVAGPDGVPVVMVESSHRRPSLLDTESHWCSEIYSVVWCVSDRDREAGLWTAAGAIAGPPLEFADPSLGAYLDLPVADSPLRMITLASEDGASTRLELLSFPGREAAVTARSAGVTGLRLGGDIPAGSEIAL
ncbi:MAG: hypothetical protein B7C54_08015 [Acidimicrobiales bacterium mtb01]|nr:hypothetical protein [Actinomycetota bacterium]TEX45060.1 MAG: hypothetical protein B7C54_08015 [Acidimicrobiales bacterium mtb01]